MEAVEAVWPVRLVIHLVHLGECDGIAVGGRQQARLKKQTEALTSHKC